MYFIKLDSVANILQPTVIPSNFARSGQIYLLNIPPGSYAAVAAFYYRSIVNLPGTPAPVRTLGNRLGFLTYFSDEMVKKSIVQVKKGEIYFAGSYIVDQTYCCKSADETQLYYAGILHWKRTVNWPDPERIYSIDYLYAGVMQEANHGEAAKAAFFRVARENLGEEWSSLIK